MRVEIRGAHEHNLQDVDVTFGDGLTVVTGVSGSGKTSLVFDTLYHEARRRFLEVFSLGVSGARLIPARVRSVRGLGPAVAVGQNLLNRNPASTLATASGLHPFLRLLYARFAERRCSTCGAALSMRSEDEVVDEIRRAGASGALTVLAPLVRGAKGSHRTLLSLLASELGTDALRVDGRAWSPDPLEPTRAHDVDVVVGELRPQPGASEARRAVARATALGAHAVLIRPAREAGESQPEGAFLSWAPACASCGTWFGDLEPVHFHTTCPHCGGEGCARCEATGLHPEAAAVRWRGLRLPDLLALSVDHAAALFHRANVPAPAGRLRREICQRLAALHRVGLGYVSLDRPSPTLSRGESQRVRLAVALTSPLEDVLHVLDEPTIGQHPADVARLLPAFRELGGPVVYVEHDRLAAAMADRAVDLGPGAGQGGGRLPYSGTPAGLWQAETPTGRYFSLRERVAVPERRPLPTEFLCVRGAGQHNLQDIDVAIPLQRLTAVTGVSGSGKSTLVEDVLAASLAERRPVGCRALEGPPLRAILVDQNPIGRNPRSNPATYTKLADIIRDVYSSQTGLSPSHFSFNRPEGACPTCKGLGAVEVAMRYLPSTWIPCSDCDGLRFRDEVLAARATLDGRALSIAELYSLEVVEVHALLLADRSLPEGPRRSARRILRALLDVGLGYLTLGQPSPTLSGGEAQRVKLGRHLGRRALSGTVLILDEPTTGLHPQDINGLLRVLDRLVRRGATVVVVEHNADLIRAADWVLDLGPGAGPEGGRVMYAGPPGELSVQANSLTGRALREEATLAPRGAPAPLRKSSSAIHIRGARAHNLRHVDVKLPKDALIVVTGVSGSGKSSLVRDVLEAEARRRLLESLSLYERQSTREGPEAPVDGVDGLGVAVSVDADRGRYNRRATVGTATELSHHLAVLLATVGARRCLECGGAMQRGVQWCCPSCGATAPLASSRHLMSGTYSAACPQCHGVGTLQEPRPEKLIVRPELPLCDGAMYSPGFFPKGYICKPFNGGYDMLQALAERYGFDPSATPWTEMTPAAQDAFLHGDPQPLQVTFRSRTGRVHAGTHRFPGFYGWVRDWDTGGTYTEAVPCPACGGARLRPEYLAVHVDGHNVHSLSEMPLARLAEVIDRLAPPARAADLAAASLQTVRRRLRFLVHVGLGYLHLDRLAATLSAGEAQRIKLAGLLGSELTSLTVLVDEPSRGLHPSEVAALCEALRQLCNEGNTAIVVEHDEVLIRAADYIVDMGPGAGRRGGRIVAQGTAEEISRSDTSTGRWLRGECRPPLPESRREPRGWLTVRGARAHNLRGEDVRLPLGCLVGVCGVSGSGKSTLVIDTLGRALAPRKQTTSVAREPLTPGEHDAIKGAPRRAILVDQTRAGLSSPADYLGVMRAIYALYADTEDARALGLDDGALSSRCTACGGGGSLRTELGFLPDVFTPCDTCRGSGYRPEAWDVHLRGLALPELLSLTIEEALEHLADHDEVVRPLRAAQAVGLGYLALRQPGWALSGGEAQRLKIAGELQRPTRTDTLYILDEPTVGQHLEDVARLVGVLRGLVEAGHTVLVVEHHPHVLAACDWLVELGPGGGPEGGGVIAAGTPEALSAGGTPTAPYLLRALEAR